MTEITAAKALVGRASLSQFLGSLMGRIDFFPHQNLSNTSRQCFRKLVARLRFVKIVVAGAEEELIVCPTVRKWVVDVEDAFQDMETVAMQMRFVPEVSSQSWKEERAEGLEMELGAALLVFEHLMEDFIEDLGGRSFLPGYLCGLLDMTFLPKALDIIASVNIGRELIHQRRNMAWICGMLNDAEEKQITDSAVKDWLDEVKQAFYEAEDLFYEIIYGPSRIALKTFYSDIPRVMGEMEVRLEKMSERFQYLLAQKYKLGLRFRENQLIHKKDVRESIIESLLSGDHENERKIGVIPILASRVSKTTLARLVYNDERVRTCFDFKAWICVSNDFDAHRLTERILMRCGRKNFDSWTPDQNQLHLGKKLMGKKFLIVLDDVRGIRYSEWEYFVRTLRSGLQGSSIIVTTHSQAIASVIVSSVPNHYLQESIDDNCRLLFAKHVFSDALRSSFHYFSSSLKRCFCYCAIFPKGYEFRKEDVVLLWMAEGLVKPSGNVEMEAIADEYFNDLVSMSVFQQSSSHQSCYVLHNHAHDLAKSVLVKSCFCLEDDGSCKIDKVTRHLSYARTENDTIKKFMNIHHAKYLRTFLPLGSSKPWLHKYIDEQVTHCVFSKLRHLRVLSLSQYQNMVELPNSIGNLKHLRYLNLSATSLKCLPDIVSSLYHLQTLILHDCRDLLGLPDSVGNLKYLRYLNLCRTSIKRLPESMTALHNLKTLILRQCKDLVELPSNMRGLINLCHLDVEGTKLQEMPPQIGRLIKLQTLTHFIVGKHSGSSITELGNLCLLRGKLSICNLQNALYAGDVFSANLKGKKHLKELELRWDVTSYDSLCILEQLQPHRNVESLSFVGYGGLRFPNWVGDPSFSNLLFLKLSGCKYCTSLPPIGQLESLKEIFIQQLMESRLLAQNSMEIAHPSPLDPLKF